MRLRVPLSLASGAAFALAFPPVGLALLIPAALAGLLWCVRGRTARSGAALGGLFGVGFMGVLLFWLRVIGLDAWVVLSLFQALYFAVLGAGLARVSALRLWPLWSAVLWLGVEVVRGSWPMGGLTWGRAAFATVDTPYVGWLPWLGANGVSLLVVLSSAVLLWAGLQVRSRPRNAALAVAGVVVGLAAPFALGTPGERTGTATVAVVQGDVPGDGDDLIAHHREVTRNHVVTTQELAADVAAGREAEPDFVVWPENTTAVDPFRDVEVRAWLDEAVDSIQVPILVGAIVDAPHERDVLNQGVVYEPGTGAADRYTKRHPVPFGEYIPYRSAFEAAFGDGNFGRLAMVPRDMLSGTRTTPIRVGDVLVADSICFDVAYDDAIADQVRGGAHLLTVQTSNAMFIHTGQIEQQFAISRLRAIETGRTVSVAAVNGRSGVIDRQGRVVATLPPRTRSRMVEEVPLVTGTPPSMVVGPWLGRGSVPAALLVLAAPLLPYRRRRPVRIESESGVPA